MPQSGQQDQEGQGILPAGDSDGHSVTRLEHPVVVDTPADQPHQLLHKNQPFFTKIETEYFGEYESKQEDF